MDPGIEIWNPADEIWKRLEGVAFVKFTARAENEPSWTGAASGAVTVDASKAHTLVISEAGVWNPMRGRSTQFNNILRWTTLADDVLRLEHLRFGPENPVHLFNLAPDMNETWYSINPHTCSEDCYSALMRLHAIGVDIW